jgi:hypothetical protein
LWLFCGGGGGGSSSRRHDEGGGGHNETKTKQRSTVYFKLSMMRNLVVRRPSKDLGERKPTPSTWKIIKMSVLPGIEP